MTDAQWKRMNELIEEKYGSTTAVGLFKSGYRAAMKESQVEIEKRNNAIEYFFSIYDTSKHTEYNWDIVAHNFRQLVDKSEGSND